MPGQSLRAVRIPGTRLATLQQPKGGHPMSDRPLPRALDEEQMQMPMRSGPSWTVTKEQLAAAERTRDYHLRRLQDVLQRSEHIGQPATRSEF